MEKFKYTNRDAETITVNMNQDFVAGVRFALDHVTSRGKGPKSLMAELEGLELQLEEEAPKEIVVSVRAYNVLRALNLSPTPEGAKAALAIEPPPQFMGPKTRKELEEALLAL